MTLWEFSLTWDNGTAVDHLVLAEGTDEVAAANAATIAVRDYPGIALSRPGRPIATDVELRWREIFGDAFPGIAGTTGRLARYARGLAKV